MSAIARAVASLDPTWASSRDVWIPRFDYDPVEVMSAEPWPAFVMVTCWEENGIGERRYVATRAYRYVPEDDGK